jgi:membrane-bound ClpP family serine protease
LAKLLEDRRVKPCIQINRGFEAVFRRPGLRPSLRTWSRTWHAAMLSVAMLLLPAALAEDAPPGTTPQATASAAPVQASFGVDAGLKSKKTVVITIHDEIDQWVVRSVQRRIAAAEKLGADTIVFDIDSPGGEMGAMLAISQAIKRTKIPTIAWVNSNAYSAAAVIAMACDDLFVTDAASFGDALPIEIDMLMGIRPLPDAEREKFIGPILADLVESARNSGRDEILVQGLVRRGIELWLVEHSVTGERLFVTEDQYQTAVGSSPDRSVPAVPSVTGPVDGKRARSAGRGPLASAAQASAASGTEAAFRFKPASPGMSPEMVREVSTQLELKRSVSKRTDISSKDNAGKFVPVAYVSTGAGVLTFKTDQMRAFGLASRTVNSDAELASTLGQPEVVRLDESWMERFARFLSWLPIRGLLVAVFLVALFVEMMHPGVGLPGGVALFALLGLVVPQLLVSLDSWWMPVAVVLGIALVAIELFLFPGVLVLGLLGGLLVLSGLIGLVVGGMSGFSGLASTDGTYALVTILLSFATAGGVMWFIGRNLTSLPMLNRIVLKDRAGDPTDAGDTALMRAGAVAGVAGELSVGDLGVVLTPLRPAGRVQFGERIYDVVAEMGFVDVGQSVRVVKCDAFRVGVEPDGSSQGA